MRRDRLCGLRILFEDDSVLVVEKPAGLLTTHTHLTGRAARAAQLTAENLLNDYVRKGQWKSSKRVWLVHRLDRDTSGVMLFAKTEAVAEAFRANWNALTEKIYRARVRGELKEDRGSFESYLRDDPKTMKVFSVRDPAQGKLARTEWRVLGREDGTTLVEATLKSGRKNQIRVQFAEAGHPVVGDVKYGGGQARRLYLHARTLAFVHPVTGEKMKFESKEVEL